MSASMKGSAAGAARRRPTSADERLLHERRSALRAHLPAHLARLQRAIDMAGGALAGPDPEASLGHLELLEEHLQVLNSTFR